MASCMCCWDQTAQVNPAFWQRLWGSHHTKSSMAKSSSMTPLSKIWISNKGHALAWEWLFNAPPSLDGVTVSGFARALGAETILEREAKALDLNEFVKRDMNVGFSGGEIKRWEVLKLFLQDPRLLLFDEPESGVDLEHVIAIGEAVRRIIDTPDKQGRQRAGLIITHTGLILNYVNADTAHIMKDGRIIHSGEPVNVFSHIQTHGYTIPDGDN